MRVTWENEKTEPQKPKLYWHTAWFSIFGITCQTSRGNPSDLFFFSPKMGVHNLMLITILPYTYRSGGSNRAHFQSSPCPAHPPKPHAIMNYLLGAGIKLHRLTDRQLCSMLVFLCHNVVPRIPTVNVMNNFDPLLLRIIAMPSCSPPRIFLWHLFRCSLRTFQLSYACFEMHGSARDVITRVRTARVQWEWRVDGMAVCVTYASEASGHAQLGGNEKYQYHLPPLLASVCFADIAGISRLFSNHNCDFRWCWTLQLNFWIPLSSGFVVYPEILL